MANSQDEVVVVLGDPSAGRSEQKDIVESEYTHVYVEVVMCLYMCVRGVGKWGAHVRGRRLLRRYSGYRANYRQG